MRYCQCTSQRQEQLWGNSKARTNKNLLYQQLYNYISFFTRTWICNLINYPFEFEIEILSCMFLIFLITCKRYGSRKVSSGLSIAKTFKILNNFLDFYKLYSDIQRPDELSCFPYSILNTILAIPYSAHVF